MFMNIKKICMLAVSLFVLGMTIPTGIVFAQNTIAQAQEKNYEVVVSGTSTVKALGTKTETYTIAATSSSEAEQKGITRFKSQYPGYTRNLYASASLASEG
jgi:hypothetical protein